MVRYLSTWLAFSIVLFVSSALAQDNVVVVALVEDDVPPPPSYVIGGTGPAGGIAFHVTNGGPKGLEAARSDQTTAPWNCDGTDVASVNVLNMGTPDNNSGAVNTPLSPLRS